MVDDQDVRDVINRVDGWQAAAGRIAAEACRSWLAEAERMGRKLDVAAWAGDRTDIAADAAVTLYDRAMRQIDDGTYLATFRPDESENEGADLVVKVMAFLWTSFRLGCKTVYKMRKRDPSAGAAESIDEYDDLAADPWEPWVDEREDGAWSASGALPEVRFQEGALSKIRAAMVLKTAAVMCWPRLAKDQPGVQKVEDKALAWLEPVAEMCGDESARQRLDEHALRAQSELCEQFAGVSVELEQVARRRNARVGRLKRSDDLKEYEKLAGLERKRSELERKRKKLLAERLVMQFNPERLKVLFGIDPKELETPIYAWRSRYLKAMPELLEFGEHLHGALSADGEGRR